LVQSKIETMGLEHAGGLMQTQNTSSLTNFIFKIDRSTIYIKNIHGSNSIVYFIFTLRTIVTILIHDLSFIYVCLCDSDLLLDPPLLLTGGGTIVQY
jgi:hypothetical protein